MAARNLSRCFVRNVYINCLQFRSCQHLQLARYLLNCTSLKTNRLLSTSRCLCSKSKDGDKGVLPNQESTDSQKVTTDKKVVQPSGSDSQKAVQNKESSGDRVKEAKEAASSSDSSSSDSESDSDTDAEDKGTVDPAIDMAAERVAEVLPGDKRKTKKELLSKIVAKMKKTAPQIKGTPPAKMHPGAEKSAAAEPDQKTVKIEAETVTENVSQQRPKRHEAQKQTLADRKRAIVEKMKSIPIAEKLQESDKLDDRRAGKRNLNDFVRSKTEADVTESSRREEIRVQSAFGGQPLGIFTKKPPAETKSPDRVFLYDILKEEEAASIQQYPPRNAWEEQIQWTREGRLWTFPIDNEAGWEEEKAVGFQEHVFLERHLKDFPQRGPIRHFMELVTVPLSKNPYLTAQQKRETIDWYRKYFKSKEKVLQTPLGGMAKFKELPDTKAKAD